MAFPFFTHELEFDGESGPKPKRKFRFKNRVTGEKKAINAVNESEARVGLDNDWILVNKKWKSLSE